MINQLILTSLRNRLAVLLICAVLLVSGVFFTFRMPVDVFPDLTAPTVTIVVEGHGMAPQEMETLVTFPIETAVNGATDVRRVRSATAVGLAIIWVEFEWGTDIYRARQTVNERLASVAATLPDQVEPPSLAPVSSIMGETMFLSLTSDQHDPLDLRTIAESQIRRRLLAVNGVSQVIVIGGDQKQYQVLLDAQRMKAFEVTMDEVAEALSHGNQNVSAGFLNDGSTESVLRGVGRIQKLADIAATTVASRNGRAITVEDVGVVKIGAAIKRGTGAASRRGPNGEAITENGVILSIHKQPSANTLELTQVLDAVLQDIQEALPEGMVINNRLFRQADFIQNSIHNTAAALLEGGLMVLLVVVLFLASMRASLITLLAIPISLVTAILALRFSGASINTMTLGGMAIAIGALVDDAIIDVENVVRRLRLNKALPAEERQNVLRVIYDASVEVRTSIVFATFIILLVFTPLLFLSGVEGRLLRPLGVAFCVSLAASLLTALTLTPALCYYLLPNSPTVNRSTEPRLPAMLKRIYRGPLDWALRHPIMTTVPAVVLLVIALIGAARMGKEFLPEFNEGALVIGLVTLPGTSLEQSDKLAQIVQQTLMQHPEIFAIGRRTGRAERDEHAQGVEASEFDLTLDMAAPEALGLPRRSKSELMDALRDDLAVIPGIQATFGQPISHRIDHMLSGTRANIAVKIFGDDLHQLRRLAHEVEDQMSAVPGVVDLSAEQQVDVPQVRVEFRRAALARYGLHISEASAALTAAFRGNPVSQVLEGQRVYDVTVRLADSEYADKDDVGEVLVDTPAGYKVPLKTLANIFEDRGPNYINRENVQRKIVVMCNVADRDMGSVVAEIQANVEANVEMPRGYYVEYGGQFETAAATNQRLAWLGALVIVAIGFLLHLMFGSMRSALLIMVNLPLALIGGIAGVYFSGGVLSVASIIGFISVFGIAARNGIMLVSHIGHLQTHEGVIDFKEAVRRGSMERLAPILMTAMAAGLALIPLALRGDEPGTEILTPMAMVILFGLLSSTILNMLVVPALYLRFGEPPRQRDTSFDPNDGDQPSPQTSASSMPAAGLKPSTLGAIFLLPLLALASCAQVDPQADFDRTRELTQQQTGVARVFDPTAPALESTEIAAYFGDGLSLPEALELALLNNRQLQADFQQVGIAHADWVQAQLLSNPSLDVMLRAPSGAGSTILEAALGMQILELWRIPARKKAAQLDLQATVLQIARRASLLVGEVQDAYMTAVVEAKLLQFANHDLVVVEEILKATGDLLQAGLSTTMALNAARSSATSAELLVQSAELETASAKRNLARLLCVDAEVASWELAAALEVQAPSQTPDALISQALENRVDLQAMRNSMLALQALVDLQERRGVGDASLGMNIERADDTTFLGPTVSWVVPIFDQNQAQIARAEFQLRQMEKRYEYAKIQIALDVREQYARLQATLQSVASAEQRVKQESKMALTLTSESMSSGNVTHIDALRAQRQFIQAMKEGVVFQQKALQAATRLQQAVGVPLD